MGTDMQERDVIRQQIRLHGASAALQAAIALLQEAHAMDLAVEAMRLKVAVLTRHDAVPETVVPAEAR